MEENKMENITESVEETTAAAEEVTETVTEDVEETVAEAEEEAVETAEEAEEEYDPTVLKGTAPNTDPVDVKQGTSSKRKSNVIVIVVCVAIVVACLIFVGFKVGWFDFLKTKVKLGDLSRIEVYKEDVEVTDDIIDSFVDSVLNGSGTTETIEDGVVELGDTANIDYKGKVKETGEYFEGGEDAGYDLSIGSGTFIAGFEDALIGKKIGSRSEIEVTFPEDYGNADLAGKEAIFEVKINNVKRTAIPELTDEWVQEYSAKYCPEQFNTVEEYRNYAKNVVSDYFLHNSIYEAVAQNSEVLEYDKELEKMLIDYSNETLTYYASMYGMDPDSYATMTGAADAEEYNKKVADNYLDMAQVVDEICKKNKITYTDEELKASIEQYMKDNKFNDTYTVDEFIEQSGETWLWLFTNLEFKFDLAMDSLKDNVVVLEEKPVETVAPEEATVEEAVETEEAAAAEDAE